jgi:hypothetical protein
MLFNVELASQYVAALPALEAWYQSPAKEKTNVGVDRTRIRGVGTGHRGTNGPLAAYDEWVNAQFIKLIRGEWDVVSLASFAGFETWHDHLVESIEDYWEIRSFPDLPRGQAFRMVDSFVKWLHARADGRPVLARAVFEHGHIIVNGPTLNELKRLSSMVPDWSTQMTLAEASTAYCEIQQLVRDFCRQFGGTPLLFDVFARNDVFRSAQAQEHAVA